MSPVDDGLLWFSVSDLARQKGVTKQALAKRLARLEGQGLIETRAALAARSSSTLPLTITPSAPAPTRSAP